MLFCLTTALEQQGGSPVVLLKKADKKLFLLKKSSKRPINTVRSFAGAQPNHHRQ
jgi:hypothetical protein